MARFEVASVPRRMPSVIIAMAAIAIGVIAAPSARAAHDPPGNSGVTTLPFGYRPHVSTRRGRGRATPGAGGPTKKIQPNGCLVMAPGTACGSLTLGNPSRVSRAGLALRAWADLRLPLPAVRTAPPRGSKGLVGLPEWVWIPRSQWHAMTKRVSAGGAWVQVTATPKQLIITPGAGLSPIWCAGPGTAYDSNRAASSQHTDCSYTYATSSASQPGAAYRVTVQVVWVGSGGAGGVLPDISRGTSFALPVAEAQSLYR